ncbi:MAG: amidohydrolase family protein [Deltaproteobacteria bacterium]|nr:amidohydrolase family protein [Deltaproteobacteria bacterium]MBT7151074.1 amidohydrolase family protein [Deltaproteobacteria bacterium]
MKRDNLFKKLPESIIDFHVHLFPDKGFDAIWKYFKTESNANVQYKFYYRECIAYLNSHGVSPIVFSNYAHKQGIAEPMNEWNIKVLEEFSNLYCFAPYHPDDDQALAYTEQMLAHPRVAGVKMHFQVQKIFPSDERLFPLYEMIIDKGKRVLLHTGNGPSGNEFVGFKQFSKLLNRYPDLPVNIPHMGCYEFTDFITLLDNHPSIYLDTAFTFWPNMPFSFNLGIEMLEKYKDNILYGSDFPNVILPREGEIEHLLSLDLSDEFYEKVFYKNGMKLLSQICPAAGN